MTLLSVYYFVRTLGCVIQDGRVPKLVEPMVLLVLRVDVSDLMRHSIRTRTE